MQVRLCGFCLATVLAVSIVPAPAGERPAVGNGLFTPNLTGSVLDRSLTRAFPGPAEPSLPVLRIGSIANHVQGWRTETTADGGSSHFVVAFGRTMSVGTVLAYGRWRVSYLKPGGWPEADSDDAWTDVEYRGETGHDLRVVPLPAGVTTGAVRFTGTMRPDRAGRFSDQLWLATTFLARFLNVAPLADVFVSSSAPKDKGFRPDARRNDPVVLNDGSLHPSWTSGKREASLSPASPEWIVLDWGAPRRLRGAAAFMEGSGFGEMQVQRFAGTGKPAGADGAAWETVGTMRGRRPWRPVVWEVYCDFGHEVKTRALRFLATKGMLRELAAGGEGANANGVALGELMAFQDLGGGPVPERVVKEKAPDGVVPVTFTVPRAGKATIQILDEKGEVVENLVTGRDFPAGKNTVWWDLSTIYDYWPPHGKPAPQFSDMELGKPKMATPGSYRWKGLWHPGLRLRYLWSYYPLKKHGLPWITSDGTGGWLADHVPPQDVIRTGDTVAVGTFCEGGHALLESDLDMKKLWGSGRIWLACPRVLATDGDFSPIDYFGREVHTRLDPTVDFTWKASPAPGVKADHFSVRWTGRIRVRRSGRYAFHTTSDDGVRLLVGGRTVLENWTNHGATPNEGSVRLAAGEHELTLEFYEHTGGSQIRLEWEGPGVRRQVVPAEVLSPVGTRTLSGRRGLTGTYYEYEPGGKAHVYYVEQGGWVGKRIIMIQVDWRTKGSRRLLGREIAEGEEVDIQGLAVAGGRAYMADRAKGKVLVLDIGRSLAASGRGFGWDRVKKLFEDEVMKVLKEIPLERPGRIRPYDERRLAVVTGTRVVLLDRETYDTEPLVTGLTAPLGLAVDAKRNVYVGEMEPVHQVKVYSRRGRLVRTIGKRGRHQLGRFDEQNLESPSGIDVDAEGNVWVCELNHNLKRTSVWDRRGRLVSQVLGPTQYGGGGCVDPDDENHVFYQGKEFRRDPRTGEVRLTHVMWRGDDKRYDIFFSGAPHNFGGAAPSYPFRKNGRLYFTSWQGWAAGGNLTLFVYDRDHVRPVAAVGSIPGWLWKRLGREEADPRFGNVIATRVDPEINFSWGGSPAPNVGADKFAVRWKGKIRVARGGRYTFHTTSDDGVRLFVAGRKVIENWTDHGPTGDSGTVELSDGWHDLKLEFYEKAGGATIRLEWEGPGVGRQVVPTRALRASGGPGAEQGLTGQYCHGGHAESVFAWTDSDDDGRAQPHEVELGRITFDGKPWGRVGATWQTRMNESFEVAFSDGNYGQAGIAFFRVKRLNEKGYPVYELPTEFRVHPGLRHASDAVLTDRKGNAVSLDEYIFSMRPDGKVNWRYRNRWPGLHAGHHTTATGDEPGVVVAPTRFFGSAWVNDEIGEVLCVNSNLGATFLFTADGLFVDRVFKDTRRGLSWYFNTPPGEALVNEVSLGDEHFGGTFQRVSCAGGPHAFRYVVGPGSPHSSVIDLQGLDEVKRLPGGRLKVTAAHLAMAERLRQRRALAVAQPKRFTVRRLPRFALDGKPDEWPADRIALGGDDRFALGYDDLNLYVYFEGKDDRAVFQNAAGADSFLEAFKTGDIVDVMLETKAGLDSERDNAAQGDIRLSMTLVGGRPVAILYDYVVPGTPKAARLPFASPWRTLYVDRVTLVDGAKIEVVRRGNRFSLEAAVPLASIHLDPRRTPEVRGDVGRVLSDQTGTRSVARVYWSNKNTNIVADVPSEARLQPNLWGTFVFEGTR